MQKKSANEGSQSINYILRCPLSVAVTLKPETARPLSLLTSPNLLPGRLILHNYNCLLLTNLLISSHPSTINPSLLGHTQNASSIIQLHHLIRSSWF